MTGAAEGIGAMLAEGFARHGMDVALLDIQESAAAETAARLARETGRECIAMGWMSVIASLMETAAIMINAMIGAGLDQCGRRGRAPLIGGAPGR